MRQNGIVGRVGRILGGNGGTLIGVHPIGEKGRLLVFRITEKRPFVWMRESGKRQSLHILGEGARDGCIWTTALPEKQVGIDGITTQKLEIHEKRTIRFDPLFLTN